MTEIPLYHTMKYVEFLYKNKFLQELFIAIHGRVHPSIEHYIGKISALKNAFFSADPDQVEGDYLEFGVHDGTSLIAAHRSWQTTRYLGSPTRSFFGFDSFKGFKPSTPETLIPPGKNRS